MTQDKNLKPLELNADFRHALNLIDKQAANLFITGKAGTGKSTFLRLLRDTSKNKMVVLAPTGVAAINVKGQTIHSFFKFPPRMLAEKDLRKRNKKLKAILNKLDLIVIDEISMVRADLLDSIDKVLRFQRENPSPFGGVQMVFIGDLFQLPPVVATVHERQFIENQYGTAYFFGAHVFRDGFSLDGIEFRKIYRQDNKLFLRLLEAVRTGYIDHDDLEDINQRFLPRFEQEDYYITLSARNHAVDKINQLRIDDLLSPVFNFFAKVEGQFDAKLFPTDQILALKEGAQVMFLRNDPEQKFYNGTIGKIVELSDESIKVDIIEGGKNQIIDVEPFTWEIIRYAYSEKNPGKITSEVIGTFTQYPLRLAWAITIHKSQGKTFEKVIIDLGRGAFAHGQVYVALSRCRTLSGIVLKNKVRFQDIIVDTDVVDFYSRAFGH